MLKDNLKTLRKNKGLSQEELSLKLHVVRQTVSKWESGLSVPDADILIKISELFETPVSDILGVDIAEKKENDLKVIAEKLEVINEQLAADKKQKRKRTLIILAVLDAVVIILFALFAALKSPYESWNFSDPEWSTIGTFWHSFEWIYFRITPFIIIFITTLLIAFLAKREK